MSDVQNPCRLSFAIMTHNERVEFNWLMNALEPYLTDDNEVVVVDDFSDEGMVADIKKRKVKFFQRALNKDFASQRNFTKSQCSGKFIFALDPDELPPAHLLERMPAILDQMEREGLDACVIPRFSKVVEGEGPVDARTLKVSDADVADHPHDDQVRLYRNSPDINWIYPLHEKITGLRRVLRLPNTSGYALLHVKTRGRLDSQDSFYKSMGEAFATRGSGLRFFVINLLRGMGVLSAVKRMARRQLTEVRFQQ